MIKTIVCAALLSIAFPCHGADGKISLSPEERAWIDENHTVRVRIGNAPPMMFTDGEIPVILCTGYSKALNSENAARIGVKAFAYKPIVKAELAETVRKVLDEAQGRSEFP